MLRFRNRSVLPPGGYFFYVVEETNTRFQSRVFDDLVRQVRTHLSANKLEIPENLSDDVEDFVCRHVDKSFCRGKTKKKISRILTPFSVRQFTSSLFGVLVHKIKGQDRFVSQEVANERAQICLTCPKNDKSLCTACSHLKSFSRGLMGATRKTKHDDDLGVCFHCGCMLEVKVHIADSILKKSAERNKNEYPDHCWLKKIGK